jgi:hypothetical protein
LEGAACWGGGAGCGPSPPVPEDLAVVEVAGDDRPPTARCDALASVSSAQRRTIQMCRTPAVLRAVAQRSSGRSIRRSFRLIPTSSTHPQGPPDMRRADPPQADVASCPIRSRRRSGGTSAATRAPISASLTAGSVDHGQAREGGRGQYDPSSQASGGAAACVSETPPSAAQDARGAKGHSS